MYGPVKFYVTESRFKVGLSKYRFGVKSQRRRPLIWTSIKMVKCGKLVLIMNGEFFFLLTPVIIGSDEIYGLTQLSRF